MQQADQPYDRFSYNDVLRHAKRLVGHRLSDLYKSAQWAAASGRGTFGNYVELHHFNYQRNSVSEPDFPEIGLELKTSPLRKNRHNTWKSKERIVLGMIDYEGVITEVFESSTFIKKNQHLLILFYEHDKSAHPSDLLVIMAGDWKYSEKDLIIIRKDWEAIRDKIDSGHAHLLSEGDTVYLGACTKGANKNSLRKQPNSPIMAMQRAFSLKSRYVNFIIKSFENNAPIYDPIIQAKDQSTLENLGFDKLVVQRFTPFVGKHPKEIAATIGAKINFKAKGAFASLTKAILGISVKAEIEEFTKGGIAIRTVRLRKDGRPKEAVSFPAFQYTELLEGEWEDSDLIADISKLFFVVYECKSDAFDEAELVFKGAFFWNTPASDIEEARLGWEYTRKLIANGHIVNRMEGLRRITNFLNRDKNRIIHVRPHAQNSEDTFPLPVPDQKTKLTKYTKHSFWLNTNYIEDIISQNFKKKTSSVFPRNDNEFSCRSFED